MAVANLRAVADLIHRLESRHASADTPDEELLRRFVAGDADAFELLLWRHARMVLGVCHRVLRNVHDAEDAFQATFLVLARKARSIAARQTVTTWLYTVAYRVALNALKERTRRQARVGLFPASMEEASMEATAPKESGPAEIGGLLDEAVNNLPTKFRDAVILCLLEGRSHAEAARVLRCAVGTVASRLARAKARLRAWLGRRGVTGSEGALTTALGAAGAASVSARTAVSLALQGAKAALMGGASQTAVSPHVLVLAQGVLAAMFRARFLQILVVMLSVVVVVGAGRWLSALDASAAETTPVSSALAPGQPQPSEKTKRSDAPTASQPLISRVGTTRFRANGPIDDARFSADGKVIVACAGNALYVWKASDGSLLRRIDTKLELIYDPLGHRKLKQVTLGGLSNRETAFAVHPRANLVACGGVRDGKTYLQIWDLQTGRAIAERASSCDALFALAWTRDGKQLLERSNVGRVKPTGWKLIVHDDKLGVVRAHDVPAQLRGGLSTLGLREVWLPLANPRYVMLWPGFAGGATAGGPTLFDLKTGQASRTFDYADHSWDLGISPDGTMLAAAGFQKIRLIEFASGKKHKELSVSWRAPAHRPLFSPDGKTVYVWGLRPIAYDVATGREKWKATFRTNHSRQMMLCDISADGATLLLRNGYALSFVDAKTGAERNPATGPDSPKGMTWSPDGRMLFTRMLGHDRTWTAWDVVTGRRLYDLQPTGQITGDDWKMLPDLFFLRGGREIVTCLEQQELSQTAGQKQLLVFDTATGKCLRKLGNPLPYKEFLHMHPVTVDPAGTTVLLQSSVVSAPPEKGGISAAMSKEHTFRTIRWDPVKQAKLQEWAIGGDRTDSPRHFAPYSVTGRGSHGGLLQSPASIRCYSLADGKLVCNLATDFHCVEPDRIQGDFLLTESHNYKTVNKDLAGGGRALMVLPQPPFTYDLWHLPSHDKVHVFQSKTQDPAVLGPGGQYIIRVLEPNGFEVYEPYILKKAVAKVATAARPELFEFSPDGSRVAVALADTTIAVWDTTPWRKQINEQLARQVPADLGPLLHDLGGDATTGFRAVRLLSGGGDKAVALLGEKLTARPAPKEAQIKQWIADLDSPRFAAREKAVKELRSCLVQAESHLRKQLGSNPSVEVRKSINRLLRERETGNISTDEFREVRAIQALQWMETEAAHKLLRKWAGGDVNATLTVAAKHAVTRSRARD